MAFLLTDRKHGKKNSSISTHKYDRCKEHTPFRSLIFDEVYQLPRHSAFKASTSFSWKAPNVRDFSTLKLQIAKFRNTPQAQTRDRKSGLNNKYSADEFSEILPSTSQDSRGGVFVFMFLVSLLKFRENPLILFSVGPARTILFVFALWSFWIMVSSSFMYLKPGHFRINPI